MTPLLLKMEALEVSSVTRVVARWPWTCSKLLVTDLSTWSLLGCWARRRWWWVVTPLPLRMETLDVSSVTHVVMQWPLAGRWFLLANRGTWTLLR